MSWILVVASISGTFSADLKLFQFPMQTKIACLAAGEAFKKNSNGIGLFCLSSESGELIKVTEK